jgi:DNA-binding protein HU-beta
MEVQTMAMTKTAIVKELAEASGITKTQAVVFVEALAKLACKEARNGFTIPGIGKLVVLNRKARRGRNPATGEAIKIKARKVLKFRVAKAAKEAAL